VALGGQKRGRRALALDYGIGHQRRSVNDHRQPLRLKLTGGDKVAPALKRRPSGIVRIGGDFVFGDYGAGREIDQGEIGKGAAHIEAERERARGV